MRSYAQDSVRAFHNYSVKVSFADGEYCLRLVVRKDANGNHDLSQIEKIGEDVEAIPRTEAGAAPITDKKKLRRWLRAFNQQAHSKVVDENGKAPRIKIIPSTPWRHWTQRKPLTVFVNLAGSQIRGKAPRGFHIIS